MSSTIDLPAVPVPAEALHDLYRHTVSMQAAQALLWRKAARRHRWGEALLLVLCTALGLAIAVILPTTRYIPVFVFTNQSGLNDTASAVSELPPTTRVAGIEAVLWQYLRDREHYAPSEADESYAIVSVLSDDPVREQYQKWANPKFNKDSPAVRLGQHGFIRIYRRNGSWVAHSSDYTDGVYQISFCRVVAPEGSTPLSQRMTATIRYQLANRIPLWQRVTTNPIGLVVTEYPGPESEDPQPHLAQLGNEKPCGS